MSFFQKLFGSGDKKAGEEFAEAVKTGDLVRARKLAEADKSVVNGRDFLGLTGLHWAAQAPSAEGVKLILEFRGKVNVTDNQGRTPLHWAVASANLEIAELLLRAGANPNATDKLGATPITAAMMAKDGLISTIQGTNPMVALLKQFGGV